MMLSGALHPKLSSLVTFESILGVSASLTRMRVIPMYAPGTACLWLRRASDRRVSSGRMCCPMEDPSKACMYAPFRTDHNPDKRNRRDVMPMLAPLTHQPNHAPHQPFALLTHINYSNPLTLLLFPRPRTRQKSPIVFGPETTEHISPPATHPPVLIPLTKPNHNKNGAPSHLDAPINSEHGHARMNLAQNTRRARHRPTATQCPVQPAHPALVDEKTVPRPCHQTEDGGLSAVCFYRQQIYRSCRCATRKIPILTTAYTKRFQRDQ